MDHRPPHGQRSRLPVEHAFASRQRSVPSVDERGLHAVETHFARGGRPAYMVDAVIAGIVVGLVLFFFFIFLMIFRTVTGFKEGMEGGRRNDRK
jgi:hypothetical protein